MRISRLKSERDDAPVTEEVTFEELVELLHTYRVTDCDHEAQKREAEAKNKKPGKCSLRGGPAWSAGISNGKRGDKNIVGMEVLVFDLDHLTLARCTEVMGRLDESKYKNIVHSTHTHDPKKDDICLRLVLFPNRMLQPSEIRPVREALIQKLGLPADPQTKNEERLYFLPSRSANGAAEWTGFNAEGFTVSVDALELVSRSPSSQSASVPVGEGAGTEAAAVSSGPRPAESVDMQALRARLAKSTNVLVKRVLRGEKLADMGARDDTLNKVCGTIAFTIPHAPFEAMLEILRESVNAMDPPEEGDWMDLAEDKLKRAHARWEASVSEKKEMQEAAALIFRKDAAVADAAQAPASEEEGPADAKPFRPEQIEQWAIEQGCDAESFARRWIIQNSGGYWIFSGGAYGTVLTERDAELSVFRDLSRAPVSLYRESKEGTQSPRSFKAICLDHGTVARTVKSSLVLQTSHYDAKTQAFHEAVCPLRRELTPAFDKEVHEYLQAFGGDQPERFLDWCALVPNLNQMLCGLYTQGEKNTGKTLFASGIARLWSDSFSTLDNVFAPFNDTLTKNPFCFADERLPKSDTVIDDIRNLIGKKTRSLNRKFFNTTDLEGCPRLYIAANNDTLLADAKASVTNDDVEAIRERIFYINHGNAPTQMLERIREAKGWEYVDTFRGHDRIARHVLWLAENRKVKMEGRFGVVGISPEFYEQLITDVENVSNILEFLVRSICKDSFRPSKLLRLGEPDGRLLVNTEFVADKSRWEAMIVSRQTPTAKKADQGLRAIAEKGAVEKDGLQFHSIRLSLLLRWAKRRGIGNVALLEKRIREGAKNGA